MILNIYKEKGWTSFDVVAKIRSVLTRKEGNKVKVGHAGTLDPLAEGVLIILTHQDTKNQEDFMNKEKEYIAKIGFGSTSESYDLEEDLTFHAISKNLNVEEELKNIIPKYLGDIDQEVPAYSAKKVEGIPLYKKARANGLKNKSLPVKRVNIKSIEILEVTIEKRMHIVKFDIRCGKGTYIRSLANDFGKDLGVGGVLVELVRTRIGEYAIKDSLKINDWMESLFTYASRKSHFFIFL
ncbi:tRNA pseudouridine(55) synthase TruB [Patescibacteria group bacterium]